MTKKAHSIIMLTEAIESMGFTLSSTDLHRLHFFTREVITRTATVKALRNAVAQFRLDPLKLLEKRGVGIKTLKSVKLLSDMLSGQETQKEFGIADNLAAVQSILSTTHRGSDPQTRLFIHAANSNITHARNSLQFHKMEVAEEFDEPFKVIRTYYRLSGDGADIKDIAGNIVITCVDLEFAIERAIEDAKKRLENLSRNQSYAKLYEIIKYDAEFCDENENGLEGCYICVKTRYREIEAKPDTSSVEN